MDYVLCMKMLIDNLVKGPLGEGNLNMVEFYIWFEGYVVQCKKMALNLNRNLNHVRRVGLIDKNNVIQGMLVNRRCLAFKEIMNIPKTVFF